MKEYIKEVKNMERFARTMPKSINEMINFEDDEDLQGEDFSDSMDDMPMHKEKSGSFDTEAFVDEVRCRALKGMAELASNPDSNEYQLLKRIWQICDKKPEDQMQGQKTTKR